VSTASDQDVVPLAVVHVLPSTEIWTLAMPLLSDADPVAVTVPLSVAPDAGAVKATEGAVVQCLQPLRFEALAIGAVTTPSANTRTVNDNRVGRARLILDFMVR
jgi:hypothetical protein